MSEKFQIKNKTTYNLQKVVDSGGVAKYLVRGDVCHYGLKNDNWEIDEKGCFSAHIKSVKDNGQAIPLVLLHNDFNETCVIGKFTEFEDGDTYLWGIAEIVHTPYITNEVIPKIEAGLFPCFSTYGWAEEGEWDDKAEAYRVKKGILSHVALVSQGADVKASATFEQIKNDFSPKGKTKNKIFNNINI